MPDMDRFTLDSDLISSLHSLQSLTIMSFKERSSDGVIIQLQDHVVLPSLKNLAIEGDCHCRVGGKGFITGLCDADALHGMLSERVLLNCTAQVKVDGPNFSWPLQSITKSCSSFSFHYFAPDGRNWKTNSTNHCLAQQRQINVNEADPLVYIMDP